MTFISALMLADRGELDLDAPVVNYWPEFGQKGKGDLPVKFFLSHSAGLPGFDPALTTDELYDWDTATNNLASQEPWWEPGSASGYHAITQGFLIGELIRRNSGRHSNPSGYIHKFTGEFHLFCQWSRKTFGYV